MRTRLGYNAYSIVEDITNAFEVWTKLADKHKPRGSSILNSMFQKLDSLTLATCTNHSDYVNQYKKAINELKDMSLHLQLDTNFFIYRFHNSLGSLYDSYVSHYIQTHDAFDRDNKAAFTLEYAIRQFLNTCKNPVNNIFNESAQTLVAVKKFKPTGCSHCKKTRHTAEQYWEKHPHLKLDNVVQRENRSKQKQDNNDSNDTPEPKKPDNSSYLAATEQHYYIAMEFSTNNTALTAEHKNLPIKNFTPITRDDFALDTTYFSTRCI